MIEFEKPNIKCLEIDNDNNYAKFVDDNGKSILAKIK